MKKILSKNTIYRDILFLFVLTSFILTVILFMTGNQYIYGSTVDWLNQHSVLPDYFRQTFYETGDFLPEFSLNLGAGQNAYNFAYYGYLNPIILFSYLLPWVTMEHYIIASSIVIVVVSIILFFYWLKLQKNIRPMIIYVVTILFACASPILYHSHMQIMFMDYIPFLILALIGIDRLFKYRKKFLLTISITLMFLTSYFFAVSGMFMISIYFIYKYLDIYKSNRDTSNPKIQSADRTSAKLEFKDFLKVYFSRYCYSVIVGIMMACVILLPAFYAILSGRGEGANAAYTLKDLFVPSFPLTSIVYTPYGIGSIGIVIVAIASFIIMEKNKARIFLGSAMIIVTSFPIAKYLLNGFLYTRNKALIPFIPLALLITALFLESLFEKKYKLTRLYMLYPILIALIIFNIFTVGKMPLNFVLIADLIISGIFLILSVKLNKHILIYIPLTLFAITCCLINNLDGTLIKVSDVKKYYSSTKASLIDSVISNDYTLFRTGDICESKFTNNQIFSKRYFSSGCYSSVYNKNYRNLCNYDLRINNPTVNDISITTSNDILFNTLMGLKYISSNGMAPAGYQHLAEAGGYTVYGSNNAYSLGFASVKSMGLSEYNNLTPEDKQLALLQYVVDDKDLPNVYSTKLEKVNIDTSLGLKKDSSGYYHMDTKKDKKIFYLDVPDNLKEYIYIIKCNIKKYTPQRATIRINGMQNSLSGLNAALPNKNFDFKFVVSSSTDLNQLTIEFTKNCNFDFSELEIYKIKYSDIQNFRNNMTMMTNGNFDGNKTITGNIVLKQDSLFTTTIPYDEGFSVYIDGKKTEYKKTDNTFIGFDIPTGKHSIKLIYNAPFAMTGKIVTLIGVILFLLWRDKDYQHYQ